MAEGEKGLITYDWAYQRVVESRDLTVIPVLFVPAVAAYALGHYAWWSWLAVLLLRKESVPAAQGRDALVPSPSAR